MLRQFAWVFDIDKNMGAAEREEEKYGNLVCTYCSTDIFKEFIPFNNLRELTPVAMKHHVYGDSIFTEGNEWARTEPGFVNVTHFSSLLKKYKALSTDACPNGCLCFQRESPHYNIYLHLSLINAFEIDADRNDNDKEGSAIVVRAMVLGLLYSGSAASVHQALLKNRSFFVDIWTDVSHKWNAVVHDRVMRSLQALATGVLRGMAAHPRTTRFSKASQYFEATEFVLRGCKNFPRGTRREVRQAWLDYDGRPSLLKEYPIATNEATINKDYHLLTQPAKADNDGRCGFST
jgi:hypothetical protein